MPGGRPRKPLDQESLELVHAWRNPVGHDGDSWANVTLGINLWNGVYHRPRKHRDDEISSSSVQREYQAWLTKTGPSQNYYPARLPLLDDVLPRTTRELDGRWTEGQAAHPLEERYAEDETEVPSE